MPPAIATRISFTRSDIPWNEAATGRQRSGRTFLQSQRLVREWRGRRYDVDIVENGFMHAGRTFKSLSEVAHAITGTRWNGPRFFGLREAA